MNYFLKANKNFLTYSLIVLILIPIFGINSIMSIVGNILILLFLIPFLLIVLSFIWSTVFSLYVFSLTTFIWGWAGVVMAHIGLIIAVYITFKFFHKAQKEQKSVFETGNYNPAKIFVVFFLVFFIFIFTKGVEVLTKSNSYSIKYEGPKKTTLERILEFVD